jgi:hypothetical protein
MPANLRPHSNLAFSTSEQPVLFLAIELGWGGWKLAFSPGRGSSPRRREVSARDVPGLMQEIAEAKRLTRRTRGADWVLTPNVADSTAMSIARFATAHPGDSSL